jgi:hypothetical protein
MSRFNGWLLFIVLQPALVPGCDDSGPDGDADADADGDADADADGDADADADADADGDADADADADADQLPGVTIVASSVAITTRETVTFTLEASDGSGVRDVTASATFASSDVAILAFYEPSTGQPLLAGTVTVTGTFEGLQDDLDLDVTLAAIEPGDLAINEVLADATVDGDPNGDGTTDGVEDELLEVVNVAGATVDLSGVLVVEDDWNVYLPRHTFAEGTALRAGEAIVLFGGGDVGLPAAENVTFLVAQNDDPGTHYGLSLDDAGDRVRLVAADATTVLASMTYGSASGGGDTPAVTDASLVLDPEETGTDYVDHSTVPAAVGPFSPGTHADGSRFAGPDGVYGR